MTSNFGKLIREETYPNGEVSRTYEVAPANIVVFTLPDLPPSTNEIHTISPPTIHCNKPRIVIKTEWKLWRSKMQKYVKRLEIAPNSFVKFEAWYFYNFYTQNGLLRVFDSTNLQDFTINVVKMKQEWDDNRIKYWSGGSTHSDNNSRVVVRLTEIITDNDV